jgi:hypothetical protein
MSSGVTVMEITLSLLKYRREQTMTFGTVRGMYGEGVARDVSTLVYGGWEGKSTAVIYVSPVIPDSTTIHVPVSSSARPK